MIINICKCGEVPELVQISEWPAQYKVACMCGESVKGAYYASADTNYRHRAAKKAAIEDWNSESAKTVKH